MTEGSEPIIEKDRVLAFERALASFFCVSNAVAVSSGTAALHCALSALGIGPGDEVLVPGLAVVMSAVPILYQGATPVFVDSAANRVDFDYVDLERKLTHRTKAVMPVYLWGASYDLDKLLAFASVHRLAVVEDACQAHGSKWNGRFLGTHGNLGCFSMRSRKLLSSGEGGFVLTDSDALAGHCRSFRSHCFDPETPSKSYAQLGYNYRLSEIQAFAALERLGQLDELIRRRQHQSNYILARVSKHTDAGITTYAYDPRETSNLFSPIMLLPEEGASRQTAMELAKRGVANSVGTFGLRPLHEWPVFGPRGPRRRPRLMSSNVQTPNTSTLLERVISPILDENFSREELDAIVDAVVAAAHHHQS